MQGSIQASSQLEAFWESQDGTCGSVDRCACRSPVAPHLQPRSRSLSSCHWLQHAEEKPLPKLSDFQPQAFFAVSARPFVHVRPRLATTSTLNRLDPKRHASQQQEGEAC